MSHPGDVGKKTTQARLRQHAIRNAIQKKRGETERRKENFVMMEIDAHSGKVIKKGGEEKPMSIVDPVSLRQLDPFNSLPGPGEQLRMLMNQKSTNKADKPVFDVEEAGKVFLDGMDSVFGNALSDPTMFHALSIALSLATTANISDVECLKHRGIMLLDLRKRMGNTKLVPSVSTLTAMLLTISYEYRVNGSNSESIAIHIRAMQDVLQQTRKVNGAVSDALRRALFWQDLYSCLFIGTSRSLSHKDYADFNRNKEFPSMPGHFVPSGFRSSTPRFSPEFGIVLQDLGALCTALDSHSSGDILSLNNHPIENFQYSIQSRLTDLLHETRISETDDPIYEACIFACFLCAYRLSTGVWEGCFIPDYCAAQVLGLISRAEKDPRWKHLRVLLLWLLFVSVSLSEQRTIRLRSIFMIREKFSYYLMGLYDNWDVLRGNLGTFIWLNHAMEMKCRQFWEELHARQSKKFIKAT